MQGTLTVSDRVRGVIAEVAGVELEKVDLDLALGDEVLQIGQAIGMAEFLEIRAGLEKEFGVKIPDELIPKYSDVSNITVRQVVILIEDSNN